MGVIYDIEGGNKISLVGQTFCHWLKYLTQTMSGDERRETCLRSRDQAFQSTVLGSTDRVCAETEVMAGRARGRSYSCPGQ